MKQPMARLLTCTAALAALGLTVAWGQGGGLSMGDSAKKFTLPVSENGEVKMKISGDEATKLSINRTEIVNMKIELMNKGLPETIITSPRAYFWTLDQRLQTRNGVRIDRGDMLITAKAMEWQLKNEKGTLRNGVSVKLTGFDLGNRQSMTTASQDLGGAVPVPEPEAAPPPTPEPDPSPATDSDDPSIFDSLPDPPAAPEIPGVPSLPPTPAADEGDGLFN